MNGNGFGQGEPDERDDAQSEPLPSRRPGQGRHTFSPLRFDSTPDAGAEARDSGYAPPAHGNGYGANGYGANGYGANGYGEPGYGANGYGANGYGASGYGPNGYGGSTPGYAAPPESGNAQAPPPGPYPSQLPGPYLSQPPGPYPGQGPPAGQYPGYDPGPPPGSYGGQRPYPRSMDQSSFDLRALDTTSGGGSSSSVLSRYGYDPGEPTYGDSLYAQSRFNASDLDVRPAGGRHAAPVGTSRPTTSRPTTSRPTSPATASGPDRRRPRKGAAPAATEEGERRHMPLWQELPLLLVVAFCLAVLIRSFLLQAFFIPSSSMEATLLIGDRVLVNKVIYDLRDPERGEIVVFRGTDKWAPENYVEPPGGVMSRIGRTLGDLVGVSRPGEKDFIKRVIGLPGDRVSCCDPEGRVYVNGVPINEPYINVNSSLDVPFSPGNCGSRRFDEVVIPAGQIFVMGDNRIVSQDARCQGPVPIENVIGRAFVIVWPSGRWDGLSVPDTFDSVPPPVAIGGAPAVVRSPLVTVGAAFVTLPLLATLVGSAPRFARRGQRRRWRPRRLRQ